MIELAGIEYHGAAGVTGECLSAIERLLHHEVGISTAVLLTCGSGSHREHCVLLQGETIGTIAVKSGFASGYSGEGPTGLSRVIRLLVFHGVAIEEVDVDPSLLRRLDLSAMTEADLGLVDAAHRVRPRRVWDYVLPQTGSSHGVDNPWRGGAPVMPLALIDDRLIDLARLFRDEPDMALLKAHIRLESFVRDRVTACSAGANRMTGAKLFASAFGGDSPKLTWPDIDPGERQGRANLFIGSVTAHRNVRAHREAIEASRSDELSEFLLLNHLYRLERRCTPATQ